MGIRIRQGRLHHAWRCGDCGRFDSRSRWRNHSRVPDGQLKDFKIIIPQYDKDDIELDAEFVGRDPRSDVNFVRDREKRDWKPVKFEDLPIQVGEGIFSVGMLPRNAGYRTYLGESIVGANRAVRCR